MRNILCAKYLLLNATVVLLFVCHVDKGGCCVLNLFLAACQNFFLLRVGYFIACCVLDFFCEVALKKHVLDEGCKITPFGVEMELRAHLFFVGKKKIFPVQKKLCTV